jgi:hypothetical protein
MCTPGPMFATDIHISRTGQTSLAKCVNLIKWILWGQVLQHPVNQMSPIISHSLLGNNGKRMEHVLNIVECVRIMYRVYWNVSGIRTKYTGMCLEYVTNIPECLEYVPNITECVWNMYPIYRNVFGICTEYTDMYLEYVSSILECVWNTYQNTGMCLEYVPNILECILNMYQIYRNVSGIRTKYTGMCLEYVPNILECVWNMYRVHWNVEYKWEANVRNISKKNAGIDTELRHRRRLRITPPWIVTINRALFMPTQVVSRQWQMKCSGTNSLILSTSRISVFKWPTRVLPSDLVSLLPQRLASIHLQLRTDTGNSWMVTADVTSCVSVSSGLSRNSLAPHRPTTGYSLYIFKVRAAGTISDEGI